MARISWTLWGLRVAINKARAPSLLAAGTVERESQPLRKGLGFVKAVAQARRLIIHEGDPAGAPGAGRGRKSVGADRQPTAGGQIRRGEDHAGFAGVAVPDVELEPAVGQEL